MPQFPHTVLECVGEQHRGHTAATRRQIVGGPAAAGGSMGSLPRARTARARLAVIAPRSASAAGRVTLS